MRACTGWLCPVEVHSGAPMHVTPDTWDASAEWVCEIQGPRWPLHLKPRVLCSRRAIVTSFAPKSSCAQHVECRGYVEHDHKVLVEMPVGFGWYESFWLNTSSLQDRGSPPSSRPSQLRHLAAPGTSHPVGAMETASLWRVPSKETFRNGIPVGLS